MKYRKITDFQVNDESPFHKETLQHVVQGTKRIYMGGMKEALQMVDKNGEVKGTSVIVKNVKVDEAKFTKVFESNLLAWFGLTKSGIKVFSYIVKQVKPNRDDFIFDIDDCMSDLKYKSKKSVFLGLGELLENRFIARTNKAYRYFINPTIFFNGDRLILIKNIHKEMNKKVGELEKIQKDNNAKK